MSGSSDPTLPIIFRPTLNFFFHLNTKKRSDSLLNMQENFKERFSHISLVLRDHYQNLIILTYVLNL